MCHFMRKWMFPPGCLRSKSIFRARTQILNLFGHDDDDYDDDDLVTDTRRTLPVPPARDPSISGLPCVTYAQLFSTTGISIAARRQRNRTMVHHTMSWSRLL